MTPRRRSPRDDPAWYTPAGLPDEVLAFDAPVDGALGVGAAGKVGLLEVSLAPGPLVSRITHQYQRSPLYLYRPVHLDPGRPDMAFLFVQQAGDGLVQGDRYRIDVECAAGSAVHVTTQAPTKVFRARRNFASQLVHLRAGAGAVLEYLPDPVVPLRGSRMFARTSVTVDPDATVLVGETLLPGRVAHGETHAYDLYWSETEVRNPSGDLLLSDLLRRNPGADSGPGSPGLLGGYDVVATILVLTRRCAPAELAERIRAALDIPSDPGRSLVGVSELPHGLGVGVRLLVDTAAAARAATAAAWRAARLALLGLEPPDLRKA